ncbi:hypothetical protein [Lentzea sp.]|uniref:hypothetical protein n=1 Tax=Lentzea sp. TaxID=56099 RepID=UPI002D103E9A|nr:hypothetical protein [Lentzea sp.]HUQ56360.1 hypothetical protein [Lentzea sp.]
MIAERLHLSIGFHAAERDWVVERLAALGSRLRSHRDELVRQVDEAETRTEPRRNRSLRSAPEFG